jgi:rhodanese-related sulfurtransferase
MMKEITPTELKERMDAGEKIMLVDVREPYEHEEFNIGGTLIPLAEIPFNAEKLSGLDDTEIVLYCRSGNRSAMAQKMLGLQHGIQNTMNLKGGMIAWKNEVHS